MAQNDSHDALIILRYVSQGNFLETISVWAALRPRW